MYNMLCLFYAVYLHFCLNSIKLIGHACNLKLLIKVVTNLFESS